LSRAEGLLGGEGGGGGGPDGRGGGVRAVEVDVLPLAVTTCPHARLLRALGVGHSVLVEVLSEADVCDARCVVGEQLDVRV
jgi:hypothetical protein